MWGCCEAFSLSNINPNIYTLCFMEVLSSALSSTDKCLHPSSFKCFWKNKNAVQSRPSVLLGNIHASAFAHPKIYVACFFFFNRMFSSLSQQNDLLTGPFFRLVYRPTQPYASARTPASSARSTAMHSLTSSGLNTSLRTAVATALMDIPTSECSRYATENLLLGFVFLIRRSLSLFFLGVLTVVVTGVSHEFESLYKELIITMCLLPYKLI